MGILRTVHHVKRPEAGGASNERCTCGEAESSLSIGARTDWPMQTKVVDPVTFSQRRAPSQGESECAVFGTSPIGVLEMGKLWYGILGGLLFISK